jgi:hypothetical protein
MCFRCGVWNGKENICVVVPDWVKVHFGRCTGRMNLSHVFRAAKDTVSQLRLPSIANSGDNLMRATSLMIISLLFNRVEKLEAGPNEEPRCLCNGVWYIDLGGENT